jgi:two-component system nitrogen regulation sensor histidine kinase GlnL
VIAEEAPCVIDSLRFEQGEGLPPLFLRVHLDPVLRGGHPAEQVLITFWDETQRGQQAQAEREQHAMDSITLLVRRLAHELQNPLAGIKGATQLLARHFGVQEDVKEYASVIQREAERLERLCRGLLVQGSDLAPGKTAFNVHELLDAVIWFQANAGARVKIIRDYDPSLPDLLADRDRLHQVFLNLLKNAAEASPAGGSVTVRTRMVGRWQGTELLRGGNAVYFAIEVEDQGAGVAEADLEHLFTPFFTTKKNGHGLGLYICYQIVRAHGGQIRYHAGRTGGAVFTVLIPLEAHG